MTTLAERAARIGATARSFEEARGTTKPQPTAEPADDAPKTSGDPPRHWWRIHQVDRSFDLFVVPSQTQAQMRELYPQPGSAVCSM